MADFESVFASAALCVMALLPIYTGSKASIQDSNVSSLKYKIV